MKKRVLAILAAMVLVTAAGCSGKSDTSGSKSTSTTEKTVSSTVSEESTARQENSGSQTSGTDTGEDTVTAVTLSANQQNGQMTIARPQAKNTNNKNGDGHKNASGLSLYYPLYVEGSEELKIFAGVCTSPYYLSLVDMVARGYSEEAYSNEQLFDENGQWVSTENVSDDYFNYADEEPGDEESTVIKFAEGPYLDDKGNYGFVLDKESLDYAVSVEAYIFMSVEDAYLELGETYDINADWETGTFYDNFDGYWFSLPNGTLLATYIVDNDEDYAVYTAPINLNGKRTNLRIIVDDDGAYIEGAWDGIDENGFAAREIKQLKAGDKIEALYYIESEEESDTYTANAYTWQKDDNVTYTYLPAADYGYKFYVKDVYGDYRSTDSVIFTIDENGDIFLTEPEAE